MKARKISLSRLWKVVAIGIGALAIAAVLLWRQQERSFQEAIDRSNETKATQTLGALKSAVEAYRAEFGSYPLGNAGTVIDALEGNNPDGLRLVVFGSGQGEIPRDPWGEEYRLQEREVDEVPEFYSTGPNRIDEQCRPGSDDIRSMQKEEAQQAGASDGEGAPN